MKWGNVKQKHSGTFMHIYAYSGIFRHIQTYSDIIKHIQSYSGIIQAFSKPSANSSIFRTLVYLESWHIQNMRHIQNPGIPKSLAHSESETSSES